MTSRIIIETNDVDEGEKIADALARAGVEQSALEVSEVDEL
jgi:hypothetical protein